MWSGVILRNFSISIQRNFQEYRNRGGVKLGGKYNATLSLRARNGGRGQVGNYNGTQSYHYVILFVGLKNDEYFNGKHSFKQPLFNVPELLLFPFLFLLPYPASLVNSYITFLKPRIVKFNIQKWIINYKELFVRKFR